MQPARLRVRYQSYVVAYLAILSFTLLSHGPLLHIPFHWDEMGQFIPASLDLYRDGSWIPHSTLPNVHPPGVMAYLAIVWKLVGFSVTATRIAMLLVGTFGILVTFLLAIELSRGCPGTPAFAAAAFTLLSPLFFAQSMLAQLDMPAMGLSALALLLFLQNRLRDSALVCVGLVLVKETGIIVPGVFGIWLVAERRYRSAAWFLLPLVPLAGWLSILRASTGHWLGNQAFADYNAVYLLHPVRLFVALFRRIYYVLVSDGHFVGWIAVGWTYRRMPQLRHRAWRVSGSFAAAHVVAFSLIGGAILERYLLPVLPVLYSLFAVALTAVPVRWRRRATALLLFGLVGANWMNPPYSFPFENNLLFATFAELGAKTAGSIELRQGSIATTFPMSAALRHPEYGYVSREREVVELAGFREKDIARLQANRPDMVVVYDTTWDPLGILDSGPARWLQSTYFGYEPQLTDRAVADRLSMRVVHQWRQRGLTMSLLARGPFPSFRLRPLPQPKSPAAVPIPRAYFFRKMDFGIMPCTPFFPSTNCVMAKSAATLDNM